MSENPFSITYKGFYVGTEKPVIIKIYKRGTLNSSLIKSMKQRVASLSLLNHHCIAKLLDGDYGWQGFYYVREYILGESLQDYFNRGEKFGLEKGTTIVDQVLQALAVVHGKGVIHGALKPANIFLDQNGIVKLADFVVEGEIKGSLPQKIEEFMKDAAYASPEELAGEAATARSDQYALGLILFELVSGRPALGTTGFAGNLQKLSQPVVFEKEALAALPGYLREIISRATMKEAVNRFASVEEFRQSIEHRQVLRRSFNSDEYIRLFESVVTQYGGEELCAESEALEDVGRIRLRWSREKHRHSILLAVIALAMLLGLVYAFFMGR